MVCAEQPVGDGGRVGNNPVRRTEERNIEAGQKDDLDRQNRDDVLPQNRTFHFPFFRSPQPTFAGACTGKGG
jgi:hypothetical protein